MELIVAGLLERRMSGPLQDDVPLWSCYSLEELETEFNRSLRVTL
ncbi:MAG: hypothetical protein AAFZ38_12575 [Myxococcota bacterium]